MSQNIQSPVGPTPIEITEGDVMVLNNTPLPGLGLTGSTTFSLVWRIKKTNGDIQSFSQNNIACPLTGNNTTTMIGLEPGWLTGVTLINTSAGGQRNQVYSQVFVGKPVASGFNMEYNLITAGVPGFYGISWPPSSGGLPTDGPGVLVSLAVGNPAAGLNFSQTMPNGVRVEIVNIRYQLVTAVAAALRQPGIKFTDALGNIYCSKAVQGTQTLSQTNQYNFSVGVGSDFSGAATLIAIPNNNDVMTALPFGLSNNDPTVIASTVTNMQAADQISQIVIRLRAWNEID